MIRNLRAALAWKNAYNAASEGRYEDCIRALRSVTGIQTRSSPWRLLEIHALEKLGRAQETLTKASSLIEDLSPKTLSADERYFMQHAKMRAAVAFRALFPAIPLPEKFKPDANSISTTGVKSRWLRTFPLSN